MAAANKPTPQAIKEQLKRILGSAELKATDKQRKFLSFVVGETLEDRASRLKGYTIALDVYGSTESFDPGTPEGAAPSAGVALGLENSICTPTQMRSTAKIRVRSESEGRLMRVTRGATACR